MKKKKALITGVSGQDGSYLSELLLSKGYEVHGIIRRSSTFNTDRIDHIFNQLNLYYGDITDDSRISHILMKVQPDEIYHLAAMSHVKVSFDQPIYTANSTAVGTISILEAVRNLRELTGKNPRIYNAASSEMFGKVQEIPQKETTPFYPRSPYGVSKVFSYWSTVNYRESYDLFACNGILYNHESQRRGETFVTRKITRAVGRILHGLQDTLYLGNLEAKRDWGYALEYVEAMWRMLQQNRPDDYVIATGNTHSVREFVEIAFDSVNLNYEKFVKIDDNYKRPAEVDLLLGDPSKASEILGWKAKTTFKDLISLMVAHDVKLAEREKILKER